MAACAPPIDVALGRSTFPGKGAPGSSAWLSASAAGAASDKRRPIRIRPTISRLACVRPLCYLARPMKHGLRKVVIPAAGLGTRFLPATKAAPKEMLPIVDTPTIQLIVEEAVKAGAQQVVVVNGRGKTAIEDHFDRAYELEDTLSRKNKRELFEQVRRISEMVRLVSIRQKEPMGLGHAVLAARPAIGAEQWFGVLLGDDLIDSEEPAIGQLARVAMETGKAAVALMPVAEDQAHLYGVAAGKALSDGNILVDRMVEKPPRGSAPSNLAV